MFYEIVQLTAACEYDFRSTANPNDPLSYLFEEWVPHYRMKLAIAKLLQPKRILEIGVRFGYSGLAFLAGVPKASYLGIDNDSATFGGCRGASNWARVAMAGYDAEILATDSQTMDRFPGERYDLIHVDGQQDEAGLHHDLELALRQGRYVLVGGLFQTRDAFLSASEFLLRNRHAIEYFGVLPGYAGELIIRSKTSEADIAVPSSSSEGLREAYTREYYLCDCGGYEPFKKSGGTILEDYRLRAVAALAECARPGRALDLGCGRGEVAISLAAMGHEVTAIDYSSQAIEIATSAVSKDPSAARRIQLICDDVNRAPISGPFDVVVVSDVIEHLTPGELDILYSRVAEHLTDDGLFIVHTYPNKWFYRYEYPRRVRQAKHLGAYLPKEPRSHFEKLMHINEQSPPVLRRQLAKHFPFHLLWFAGHECKRPVENLERRYSLAEMRASGDLFAVASRSPVTAETILGRMRMEPLRHEAVAQVGIEIRKVPERVHADQTFETEVRVFNNSPCSLRSGGPNAVHISYHWVDIAGSISVFDGLRTPLIPAIGPGAARNCRLLVQSPGQPGTFILRATLVQEFVQWFDQTSGRCSDDACVEVLAIG